MTVRLDAGHLWDGTTLTEVAAQSCALITAPVGNPRIDRIVIDKTTGAVSVVGGTPAGSPAAPAIPAGKIPVAQVLLATTSTTITNSMITDERALVTTPPATSFSPMPQTTVTGAAPHTTAAAVNNAYVSANTALETFDLPAAGAVDGSEILLQGHGS